MIDGVTGWLYNFCSIFFSLLAYDTFPVDSTQSYHDASTIRRPAYDMCVHRGSRVLTSQGALRDRRAPKSVTICDARDTAWGNTQTPSPYLIGPAEPP